MCLVTSRPLVQPWLRRPLFSLVFCPSLVLSLVFVEAASPRPGGWPRGQVSAAGLLRRGARKSSAGPLPTPTQPRPCVVRTPLAFPASTLASLRLASLHSKVRDLCGDRDEPNVAQHQSNLQVYARHLLHAYVTSIGGGVDDLTLDRGQGQPFFGAPSRRSRGVFAASAPPGCWTHSLSRTSPFGCWRPLGQRSAGNPHSPPIPTADSPHAD